MATRDKVGRHEVPRADIATLKKIANPLQLGVMHEAAFVLGHDWEQLIERKAAGATEVTVSQLHRQLWSWNGLQQRVRGAACRGAVPRLVLLSS
jgi:hypothetical protein